MRHNAKKVLKIVFPIFLLLTSSHVLAEEQPTITIILMSGEKLPPEFEEGLTRVVHKAHGDKPAVRIFPILAARQRVSEHQDVTK